VLFAFGIAFVFLQDLTVIDSDDPDNDVKVDVESDSFHNEKINQTIAAVNDNEVTTHPEGQCSLIQHVKPMFDLDKFQQWFPLRQQAKRYKIYPTIHAKTIVSKSSSIQSISNLIQQFISVLRIRNSWKVIVFSFASVAVSLQWTASDISLPPFLERRFGEDIPIYTIQNIHMLGSMILPPIVGAMSSGQDDFDIIMPGLWIMAVSPIALVISPTVYGACAWQMVLTIGQVLWSPRQDSWVVNYSM
jgi:hypothetical protein